MTGTRFPFLRPFGRFAAAAAVCVPGLLPAQMHHIDRAEKVTRAVGVYEWTGPLDKPSAARFVPVSLFINGHLEDAGLYLARPVPFALQSGDVYAVERAGEPQGLLDLQYAQRVVTGQAIADDNSEGAWYAYGRFTPEAPPKPAPALKASTHPPVILENGKAEPVPPSDSGPHMSRRSPSPTPSSSSPEAGKGGSTESSAPGGSTGSTNASDDTDRPTLRRRDPAQDAARRRDYGKSSKQASVTAVGPDPADDPDRPILGRNDTEDKGTPPLTGLPADLHQAVAVSDPVHRDSHEFSRPWDSPAERATTMDALAEEARRRVAAYLAVNRLIASRGPLPPEPLAAPTPVPAARTTPAAANDSDDAAHPTLRRGVPSQYASTVPPSTAAELPGAGTHAAAAGSTPPAPAGRTPAPTPHSARRTATHPDAHIPAKAPISLEQQHLESFSLSYGGLPTFVYSAAVPAAAASALVSPSRTATAAVAKAGDHPATLQDLNGPGLQQPFAVFVTLVAQQLPTGALQVALSSITDAHHLDRTPRLRLVDAVDPDDSHRASLMFELRGASSRQFGLYRLAAVQAEPIFTTASIE